MLLASVVLLLPLEQPYTYIIPQNLSDSIRVGCRVLVPVKNRYITGIVVDISEKIEGEDTDKKSFELKEIVDVLDAGPVFSSQMLALTKWISEYYLSSWGEALKIALPPGIHRESKRLVRINPSIVEVKEDGGQGTDDKSIKLKIDEKKVHSDSTGAKILEILKENKNVSIPYLSAKFGKYGILYWVNKLENLGYIEKSQLIKDASVKKKFVKIINLKITIESIPNVLSTLKSPKEKLLLNLLKETNGRMFFSELRGHRITSKHINSLKDKGYIEVIEQEVFRKPDFFQFAERKESLTPTDEQKITLEKIEEAIQKQEFKTILIHGVTGSGKTEVYIRLIDSVIKSGKRALVLVPEISLTPQAVSRFYSHFQEQIAVLHSRISKGERYDTWRRIRQGEFNIVVGARSAIFAPIDNLGLIIIDEEQDRSYKQMDKKPLYNARDTAIMRGKLCNAVVVLGSATPSLESYFNVKKGKYALCELTKRIDNRPLPKVEIVDMRQEYKDGNWSIFSKILKKKIDERIEKKEQVILFLNRRGFANFLQCYNCGFVIYCPHCNVSLTYHKHPSLLICHYCGHRQRPPDVCPNCQNPSVKAKGKGTQKIEEEIKNIFPTAEVLRMDADTTRGIGSHGRILVAFEKGDIDILVGTQMVAKGHDFPNVTLVGVVSADIGLNIPDFRSSEYTFQLLTQVSGRSGRGEIAGEVVIQTFSPNNYSILSAQKQNYHSFYNQEIAKRNELTYPPFSRIIRLIILSRDEEKARMTADELGEILRKSAELLRVSTSHQQKEQKEEEPFLQILGPAPAPLTRIRNSYRYHIMIKGKSVLETHKLVIDSLKELKEKASLYKVKITVDVDPVSML